MFEIGQYFLGSYPPEVAEFCNARGDCFIKEVEPVDGKRRFQIIPNAVPSLDEVKQSRMQRARQVLDLLQTAIAAQ